MRVNFITLQYPSTIVEQITSKSKSLGVTPFSIYLTSMFLSLHKYLNVNDLVIGTPAVGRAHKNLKNLIGNFISLVCIRNKITSFNEVINNKEKFNHLLLNNMQNLANAMSNQAYQYDMLVKDLGLNFEQDKFPLTRFFISYLKSNSKLIDGNGSLGFAVKFDLMIYVFEQENNTAIQMQYKNNLFTLEQIKEMKQLFIKVLKGKQ